MDICVANVVPYPLGGKIHSESVRRLFEMCKGVCLVVASAADAAADKTYPEIEFGMAYAAFA